MRGTNDGVDCATLSRSLPETVAAQTLNRVVSVTNGQ
jgi:hypothetical protein